MNSYIEQLEILRDANYQSLLDRIAVFTKGKCVKNIKYISHPVGYSFVSKYEAYIYYTTPKAPEISLVFDVIGNDIKLDLTINSQIALTLAEIGVYYTTTGRFTRFTDKILFSLKYGSTTQYIYNIDTNLTYYMKPYVITCLGYTYGEIQDTGADYLVDTYGNYIFDIYNEKIASTY